MPVVPDDIARLLASRQNGTLATLRGDGRPQLSVVTYAWYPDDDGREIIRISTVDGRAKVANLRRDPRASFLVSNESGWSYAVVEGTVELSPMDPESLLRWEDYSRAKDEMMAHTDLEMSPWWVVESEDKKTARINVIAHLLDSISYHDVKQPTIVIPKRPERQEAERPPKSTQRFVPDVAGELKR